MANNTLGGKRIPADIDPKAWIHNRVSQFGLKAVRYNADLANYTKFMVVRHPLDRLLSAYYDKAFPQYIRNGNRILKGRARRISEFALNNFHKHESEADSSDYNASFWEFSQYTFEKMDRHWTSYFGHCGQCVIDYDYILRTETMNTDANLFLSHSYPELTSLPAYNHMRSTSAKANVKSMKILKEFQDFSDSLVAELLKRYQLDMDQFGYHYDVDSQTAMCSFQSANGEKCC